MRAGVKVNEVAHVAVTSFHLVSESFQDQMPHQSGRKESRRVFGSGDSEIKGFFKVAVAGVVLAEDVEPGVEGSTGLSALYGDNELASEGAALVGYVAGTVCVQELLSRAELTELLQYVDTKGVCKRLRRWGSQIDVFVIGLLGVDGCEAAVTGSRLMSFSDQ